MTQSNFTFFNRRGVNIDISHRCALECLRCQRTRYYTSQNKKVPGEDMSVDDFKKVIKFFNKINFCGQYSDPVHHPKFIEFLQMTYKNKNEVMIHNASSSKTKEWYIKAFQANPNARWVFGIDGLPEQSHLYRKNQDGVKLFNIMLESKKYLKQLPVWQIIVFRYNEDNLEKCKEIADKEDIMIMILQSSRWINDNDWLIPKNANYKMKRK
jgi:MoaA/NifB/PqqE/SkfB family radical SAM enzyme